MFLLPSPCGIQDLSAFEAFKKELFLPPIDMQATVIRSSSNPHYQQWLRLLRSHGRKKSGFFLIEGKREISRAIEAKVSIECLVFNSAAYQTIQEEPLFSHFPSYLLSDRLFQKLSVREHPDGFLGVAKRIDCSCDHLHWEPNGFYLLVEQLEKPGNVGALLRSAEATQVEAVLIADPLVDPFNPNVIRASQGAVFQVPIYQNTAAFFLQQFQAHSLPLWATTPHATQTYWDCDFTHGGVLCIGNEAHGLSSLWLKHATPIQIPMYGKSADSLNAAIAGSLCLYEARRQRTLKKPLK